MRSALTFFFAFILLTPAFGQYRPRNFYLQDELQRLGKTLDETPASNSINDILFVGDTIWLATSRGLTRSTDKGKSWINTYGTPEFGSESVSALAYDSRTKTIWAATAHSVEVTGQTLPEGSGLRCSSDGGKTWMTIPQPLDNQSDTTEKYGNNVLKALPVTTRVQNIAYDIAITPNVIWLATFAGGLRKNRIDSLLANNNHPWKRVVLPPDVKDTIKPSDNLNFCLSPVAGKFCGDNNLNYRVFSLTVMDDTVLFAGTANGVNRTYDTRVAETSNDMKWEKSKFLLSDANTISGNFIVALDYNPASRTIWAATWKAEGTSEKYGVSFSGDGGTKWRRTLLEEKAHNFGSYNSITIAAADNGPFRSYDYGNTWILPGPIVDSLTFIPLRTNVFYSASFHPSGNAAWLGSNDGLVYQSGNQIGWGKNWRIFFASRALASKSETYAFPNPFSPKTEFCKIKYSTGGKTANVTIKILSFSMKHIRTLIQNAPRGNYSHQVNAGADVNGVIDFWDGKDDAGNTVPNGVYFYRVEVDGTDPMFGKVMVLQ